MKINSQRGAGMFEIIVVLSLIAILMAGVAYWWSVSSKRTIVEKTATQIVDLAGTIQETWGAVGSYAGLTEAALVGASVLPNNMVSGSNIVLAATKGAAGDVSIAPQTVTGVGCNGRANCNNAFSIRLSGLDNYQCNDLARRDYGANYYNLVVGRTGGPSQTNISTSDIAAINLRCSQGRSSNYYIIISFM